jgi:hypothetical protein
LGLWLHWLGNTTSGFHRENAGCELGHREHVGRQVVYESHRRPFVALYSPCRIWLEIGLGAGTLQPRPNQPPIIQ